MVRIAILCFVRCFCFYVNFLFLSVFDISGARTPAPQQQQPSLSRPQPQQQQQQQQIVGTGRVLSDPTCRIGGYPKSHSRSGLLGAAAAAAAFVTSGLVGKSGGGSGGVGVATRTPIAPQSSVGNGGNDKSASRSAESLGLGAD